MVLIACGSYKRLWCGDGCISEDGGCGECDDKKKESNEDGNLALLYRLSHTYAAMTPSRAILKLRSHGGVMAQPIAHSLHPPHPRTPAPTTTPARNLPPMSHRPHPPMPNWGTPDLHHPTRVSYPPQLLFSAPTRRLSRKKRAHARKPRDSAAGRHKISRAQRSHGVRVAGRSGHW